MKRYGSVDGNRTTPILILAPNWPGVALDWLSRAIGQAFPGRRFSAVEFEELHRLHPDFTMRQAETPESTNPSSWPDMADLIYQMWAEFMTRKCDVIVQVDDRLVGLIPLAEIAALADDCGYSTASVVTPESRDSEFGRLFGISMAGFGVPCSTLEVELPGLLHSGTMINLTSSPSPEDSRAIPVPERSKVTNADPAIARRRQMQETIRRLADN